MRVAAEVQTIEAFFHRRLGRETIFLPSGRVALYLAFREWLRPGDRLLMSPVNCDVVLFAALASGLVPVFAPVEPATGNIDPAAVDDSTWATLHAVVTTNLYGIPDRMDLLEDQCRRHGLVLVEDASHAVDSRFEGRRIGTFGTAAVFSLAKHAGGVGGVLSFLPGSRRESLDRRAAAELRHWPLARATASSVHTWVGRIGAGTRARRWVAALRQRRAPSTIGRTGHRMPYELGEVLRARREGGGLDRFDRWLRDGKSDYRTWPLASSLRATVERLEGLEDSCRRRRAGTRRLLELGYASAGMRIPADSTLFRVPLFVDDREDVAARLAARGLSLDYIYDPPLDLHAAALSESLPSPASARIWSRNVLPLDPLEADRLPALLAEMPASCRPWRGGVRSIALGGHRDRRMDRYAQADVAASRAVARARVSE